MSNETLSYLGYEDLNDFSAQHSDFANLLVNKEGYIYKFQNFSWIDFILYSGSPNKSALLQLKSGEPLEIKLSVKEVHLLDELGGSSKFYAVRILAENFVNIAAKTDASITKQSPPKNSFNLNNLMDTPSSSQEEPPAAPALPKAQEEEQKEDFVLNFPTSQEEEKEPEKSIKLDFSELQKEEFVLADSQERVSEEEKPFKLNLAESIFDAPTQTQEEEKKNDVSLNFLQQEPTTLEEPQEDQNTQEESKSDFLKLEDTQEQKEEDETLSGFTLKHLKPDAQKCEDREMSSSQNLQQTVEPQEESRLNFLKPLEEKEEEIASGFTIKHSKMREEEQAKPAEEKIRLNFLQEEREEEITTPPAAEVEKETAPVEGNLNFLKPLSQTDQESNQDPINKERIIAQIQNDIKEIDEVEEENFSLQHKEDTISFTSDENGNEPFLFNKNEVKNEKKSFTKTLQSLFAESATLGDNQENTEAATVHLTQEPQSAPMQGEKDNLLSEFVRDARENVRLFKDFYHSDNIDQATYTLIKMQTSANILNLNDIIDTLTEVKQAAADKNSKAIEPLIVTLEEQVQRLESSIAREAV